MDAFPGTFDVTVQYLRTGGVLTDKSQVMEIDTKTFIESITSDTKLQAVLAGNNMLYAGQPGKTPFYVHAMILNSYIESSWKCIHGGSQIGKFMAKNIRRHGGVVKRHAEVKQIVVEAGRVTHVLLADGSRVEGNCFISNMHPAKTLEMTDTPVIKNVFRKRINGLENSISVFIVNIVFKSQSFKYLEQNYHYQCNHGRIRVLRCSKT